MKFIKNVLLILLFLFITSITALWAVTYFVQPKAFKLIAKNQLSALTQQDSAIDGRINWRIFPRPGLHLTKVRIGDVKKIDGDYALSVDSLLFHVQLTPLFHGKLVFDKLMLDNFVLRINMNETTSKATPSEKKQKAAPQKSFKLPTQVALKSLLLTNGKIIFNQQNEELLLKNVRLEAKLPDAHRGPFPIQLKATLQKKSGHFLLGGTVSYKGLLKLPSLHTKNIQLEKMELDGQTTLQDFHTGEYDITKANAHVFFRDGKLELNPLTLSLYNGESVGKLTYQLNNHELKFNQTGTGLNAEPVFQHVLDVRPSRLSGSLDFSVHATTKINTPDWHKKLKLIGSFTVRNGMLAYINLPALTAEATKTLQTIASQNIDMIQQSLGKLKPWNLDNYSGTTAFQLFNLQYRAKGDGILDYSVLLETKKLNLKGHGTLNVETEALKAELTAYIITKNKTTNAIQQLMGHGFPLLVTGTLQDPMISVDRRLIRHFISNGALPKTLIEPLKKLKKHIKKINYEPSIPPSE